MRESEFNWGPGLFIIIYHVVLALTLPIYFYFFTPSLAMCLMALGLYFASCLSITAGYHRLYAHKTYKANSFVEFMLLYFGSLAAQGSVLRWAFDHRLHHSHCDHDEDPYSIKKGFWYAHILWIFTKPQDINPKVVPDLLRNKMVMFQDRYYGTLMVVTNVLTCGLVGWWLGDFWGALFIAGLLRMFCLHHSTWFINSLAHTWGWKPFSEEQSAVDNYILSFLTFGEGYHNYHHTFANDYRNGIRWYHFDPTKWFIWTLSKLGLTHNLKRTDAFVIKKRMLMERKDLVLKKLEESTTQKKEEIVQKVQEMSNQIAEQLSKLKGLSEQYYNYKNSRVEKDLLANIVKEMRESQRRLKQDWREWVQLSRNILQHDTLATA